MSLKETLLRIAEEAKKGVYGVDVMMADDTGMTDDQRKKREKIVLSMKDKQSELKAKYGDAWQRVMYATATKLAMKEEYQLDELARGNDFQSPDSQFEISVGKKLKDVKKESVMGKIANETDPYDQAGSKYANEAKNPKSTALERFRKAAAERQKKHDELEKKPDGMSSAIDRLEKHLNKEETEKKPSLALLKLYSKGFKQVPGSKKQKDTIKDIDAQRKKDKMDELAAPTGPLKNACWTGYKAVGLKTKNGKQVPNCVPEETQIDELSGHKLYNYIKNASKDPKRDKGVIKATDKYLKTQEETKQIDELNYDTVKSLYAKRRAMRDEPSKKSKEVKAQNVKTSNSRLMGFKSTQNQPFTKVDKGTHYELVPKNEEVDLEESGLLNKFILAKGLDPKRMDAGQKSAYARTKDYGHFKDSHATQEAVHVDDDQKEIDDTKGSPRKRIKEISGAGEGGQDWNDELKEKKVKKLKEDHVTELEKGLHKLDSHSYMSIHRLMMKIAKKHDITGKDLHDDFKEKHGKIPDDWIKEKKLHEDKFQDAGAATQTVGSEVSERKKQMTKSARIIKDIYKKKRVKQVKEDLYDHEKADKEPASYGGKKPKIDVMDDKKKDNEPGGKKAEASVVMSGGTTLTGKPRDTVEVNPMLRNRPGQPKVGDGDKDKKKDDKKKQKDK